MAFQLLWVWTVRLSRFVVAFRDAAPGEYVLYDVVGDRYAAVDDRLLASIERWKTQPRAPGPELEAQAALEEMGFLVNGEGDDGSVSERMEAIEFGMA